MRRKNVNEANVADNVSEDDADIRNGMLYSVEDTPPWYLCILLGFQHYLTAVGALISVPILLSSHFCMDRDKVGLSELIGTIFFVSGLATLLQTTFGVRLPIVQGGTFSFVAPTIAIMAQWGCPYTEARDKYGESVNFTALGLPEVGSEEHRDIWMERIREIQGAIIVSSVFQVVIGFSGLMGFVLRFIGPLAITPTISLIGLSLQYLRDVNVPWFTFGRGGCQRRGLPIFILFPVLLAMGISWGICAVLTVTDVLPRQWGLPTVSAASVFGMLAGVLASMIESVGDYYACARLSGAPPPPTHAVNRGIGIEGIGCILAGAWGSGNGTTSYSENIGAIGVTKVGSVRVVQVGGIVMLLLGCFGKFGALFATIPAPVVGGMFMVTFGMVTAVGLSNLQYVDLNSSRNIFILGLSLFFGLSAPFWVANNPTAIDTGSTVADQIFSVLLSTSMFVGGFIGFVLDNTIPGTPKERGLLDWRKLSTGTAESQNTRMHIYDLPLIQPYLDNISCLKYMPFCPNFMNKGDKYQKKEENGVEMNGDNIKSGIDNTAIFADKKSMTLKTELSKNRVEKRRVPKQNVEKTFIGKP
ncbi:S23A1-like protein [Mya arenaria]|uniref:S23A1-like protein n=1 Tax=Mya arenaria TaxID=6604 RepID=A0ABY7DEG9_MYAAR|nr:S23A1-like protein [Mya arenaria]